MNKSPAADPATCGQCHPDVTPADATSLHSTLRGYDTVLFQRSAPEHTETLKAMEQNHCASCHTTCGDCHVSQPKSVGGGLLKGHTFVKTPPMSQTCTACHGSRVKNEYFGLNEGMPSDVHFRARMSCSSCHTADEIHGVGMQVDHRYSGVRTPTCESCHKDQIGVGSGIEQHEVHGTDTLSCEACHSVAYTNCEACHVALNDDKLPFYKVTNSSLGFYLGRNAQRSAQRPYRYVPVRHVPIDVNSFSFYGDNLLPNFDSRPTWAYSTPHNIQRITPQNQSCTSCHDNRAVFLTPDKVTESERKANAAVIVEKVPPLPEDYKTQTPAPAVTGTPGSGDFWGGGASGPEVQSTPTPSGDFWGGEPVAPNTPAPTATTSDGGFWGQ
jgi:thiosulfate/3-mercaptopyruvate sulfurtransferase